VCQAWETILDPAYNKVPHLVGFAIHRTNVRTGKMAEDELAEINGIKPKVVMVDGEEREVSSMTRQVQFEGNK
jgi:hypothetical protein